MTQNGGCVLFDPQFSTEGGLSAPWDHGAFAIRELIETHECNDYCIKLHLTNLKALPPRPRPRPLHISNTNVIHVEALPDLVPVAVPAAVTDTVNKEDEPLSEDSAFDLDE